jgi:hypothetical protein
MAATTIDLERRAAERATTEQRLDVLELEQIEIKQRLTRQDSRLNWAMGLAIAAAAGGILFGIINFAMLLLLFSRLT